MYSIFTGFTIITTLVIVFCAGLILGWKVKDWILMKAIAGDELNVDWIKKNYKPFKQL